MRDVAAAQAIKNRGIENNALGYSVSENACGDDWTGCA